METTATEDECHQVARLLLSLKEQQKVESPRSILNAWLRAHRTMPYPNAYEKHMLQTQTGLCETQLNNWFANARRRKLLRGTFGRRKKTKFIGQTFQTPGSMPRMLVNHGGPPKVASFGCSR